MIYCIALIAHALVSFLLTVDIPMCSLGRQAGACPGALLRDNMVFAEGTLSLFY